jgi:hypothetical protein
MATYPLLDVAWSLLVLAGISLVIWIICAVKMALTPDPTQQLRSEMERRQHRRRLKSFIRSLLYNQVPLRAFLNWRSVLASITLTVSWICATYFLPYLVNYIGEKRVTQVSC